MSKCGKNQSSVQQLQGCATAAVKQAWYVKM